MTSRLAILLQKTTPRQRGVAFGALLALLFVGIMLPGDLKAGIEGQLWNDFPWSAAAHITLFAAVAAFPVYGRGVGGVGRALLFTAGLAVLTELAQGLVPGRHPMVRDVLIDLFGASLGLCVQQKFTRLVHGDAPR